VTDRISLTFPGRARFRAVATLVLGGVGSRLELPYERVDDLQLALLSILDSSGDDQVTLELEASDGGLAISLGPLEDGTGADRALARVLEPLVDSVESGRRDGQEWITLRVAAPPS
jgi:hypothetical protein